MFFGLTEVTHMFPSRGAMLLLISSLIKLAFWSVTSVWGLVTQQCRYFSLH